MEHSSEQFHTSSTEARGPGGQEAAIQGEESELKLQTGSTPGS